MLPAGALDWGVPRSSGMESSLCTHPVRSSVSLSSETPHEVPDVLGISTNALLERLTAAVASGGEQQRQRDNTDHRSRALLRRTEDGERETEGPRGPREVFSGPCYGVTWLRPGKLHSYPGFVREAQATRPQPKAG